MRTVKVQGGLGNQLFCLAFAHSITVLTGEATALDVAAYRSDRYGHNFDLSDLAARLGILVVARHPFLSARATTALMRAAPMPGYVSQGPPPDDGGLRALAHRGGYFNGYWQDEVYIAEPELLRRQVRDFLLEKGAPVIAHDLVIHYRTYKEEVHPDRRRVPGPAFFRRAMAYLEARHPPPGEIVLISDDPALALQRLGDFGRRVVVAQSRGPWADMALMIKARDLILTNSSFSWWGGFCGDAQVALYPERGDLFHYPCPAARFTVI